MKTTTLKLWTAVCLSVLTTAVGFRALADQTTTAPKQDKTYKGMVAAVDPQNHVLAVKGTMFSKKFNLGDSCQYTMLGRLAGSVGDVRTGQKVKITYRDAEGVLVAGRVEQQPMRYTGEVRAVDPENHTITLHARGLNREFQIGDNCMIVLRNNRSGTLNELKPGQRVIVTYEIPNGTRLAQQIAHTSATYEGELIGIDLSERTLKVRAVLNSKKFNLARDCAVVLRDRTDAPLRMLQLGDKLVLNYDDVDGVSVVNRIALAQTSPETVTAQVFDR